MSWEDLLYKIMLAVLVGCAVALIVKWSELRASRAAQARQPVRRIPEDTPHRFNKAA